MCCRRSGRDRSSNSNRLKSTCFMKLFRKLSSNTTTNLHSVLVACLGTATRTRKLARNPMAELAKIPSRGKVNHGTALEEDQLRALLAAFKGSTLFSIVAVAAFTGARRNEILALRWTDLNVAENTLRIERALEETNKHGVRVKEPKTERGKRTIKIDDEILAHLVAERERHLRVMAGVADGTVVDLSLVKLPAGALMFPSPPGPREDFSFTKSRNPRPVTNTFRVHAARKGFKGVRFHDLRGTHETLLLDRGVPVHVVAARCGHDPAVLLRAYAKRTRKADDSAAEIIAAMSKGALQEAVGSNLGPGIPFVRLGAPAICLKFQRRAASASSNDAENSHRHDRDDRHGEEIGNDAIGRHGGSGRPRMASWPGRRARKQSSTRRSRWRPITPPARRAKCRRDRAA